MIKSLDNLNLNLNLTNKILNKFLKKNLSFGSAKNININKKVNY